MSSKIVVATASTTIFIGTQRVHVRQGSAWAADSVAVTERPDLFSDDAKLALGLDLEPSPTVTPVEPEGPVEQKTAAPGEKSDVKRRGIFGRRDAD